MVRLLGAPSCACVALGLAGVAMGEDSVAWDVIRIRPQACTTALNKFTRHAATDRRECSKARRDRWSGGGCLGQSWRRTECVRMQATHASVRGLISNRWALGNGDVWGSCRIQLEMNTTIPFGARASVTLPSVNGTGAHVQVAEGNTTIFQNGKFLPGPDGVAGAVPTDAGIVVDVRGGDYAFRVLAC